MMTFSHVEASQRGLAPALIVSMIVHAAAMAGFFRKPAADVAGAPIVVGFTMAPQAAPEAPLLKQRIGTKSAARPVIAQRVAGAASQVLAASTSATEEATGAAREGGGVPALGGAPGETSVPQATPVRFNAGYLDNPRPAYPSASRALGEQGTVLLLVQVSAMGAADDVTLQASSGYPRLDRAALEAVRGWRFIPARHGETAIAASVIVPIAFSLRHSS